MASRNLNDLDSRIFPLAVRLLGQAIDAGVPLTVITTLRSQEEQELAVKRGYSWTLNSKHLPQPPSGKSLAIDVCPTELLSVKNWGPDSPLWWKVAELGVALGLRSGMDWQGIGLPPVGHCRACWDPGHFEVKA